MDDKISIMPIISLTPLDKTSFNFTIPLARQILMNPNEIFYDPHKVFIQEYPNYPAIYVKSPDLNDDIQVKRSVYESAWKKFKTLWIYKCPYIFKYVERTQRDYRLVRTLKQGKKAKHDSKYDSEKATWLILNFFTLSDLANAVEVYRKRMDIDIYDVMSDEYESNFSEFVCHQLRRKMVREIGEK